MSENSESHQHSPSDTGCCVYLIQMTADKTEQQANINFWINFRFVHLFAMV